MASLALRRNPAECYRRVAMDAAVMGSDPRGLTRLCYTELVEALHRALFADREHLRPMRGGALLRSLAALSGLRAGLDQTNPLAPAFDQLFGAADRTIRAAIVSFDSASVVELRQDFLDLNQIFAGPGPGIAS